MEDRHSGDRTEPPAAVKVTAVTQLSTLSSERALLPGMGDHALISTTPKRLVVTVSEAASMLGLSRAKLYPLISSGEIRSLKIGKCRRVPVRELESFIERQFES